MKKHKLLAFAFISILSIYNLKAQKQNKLVAKNAEVEMAATGFTFTEGPAVAKDGRVYFTDQPNDRIHIWDEKTGVSLYLEGTGRSNGMYFNAKEQLVTCADEKNQLGYFDENKKLVVLFENYDGKHLNAPNDLWIAPNGGIYFSDPYYQRTWWSEDHEEIQDTRGVYFLNAPGEATRIIDDFEKPNGLIGTPMERFCMSPIFKLIKHGNIPFNQMEV